MDNRLYFVLGDLFSNIFTGLAVGWIVWLLTASSWNMFLAMIIMMFVGMVIAGILSILLGYWFGAMETMVPLMFSGMLSGMVISMWETMHPLSGASAASIGAVCGLVGLVVIWVLNNSIRGQVIAETGDRHE